MDWIVIPLNVLVIFGTIYKLFELFVRKEERLTIIRKIEEIKNVDLSGTNLHMGTGSRSTHLALHISLLAIGVGLGIFFGEFFSMLYYSVCERYNLSIYGMRGTMQTACICFFGGIMLMLSYFMARRYDSKAKEREHDGQNGTEA